MKHLPVFLDVSGRPALVVGGGPAAAAKARLLADAGAAVQVIAEAPGGQVHALSVAGRVALARRPFAADDVHGRAVVVAASGEAALDARVAAAARAKGVPVNVMDRAELSTFVFPAIVDRGEVVVGISTGGAAPVLARDLRARIERALPDRVGALAAFARAFRPTVQAVIPDRAARRRFWEEVFAGPIAAAVLAGAGREARRRMLRALNPARQGDDAIAGRVLLVGAGPGDPDLLTLRAVRALDAADVIVHDDRIDERVLGLARREAERIAVGARRPSPDAVRALLVARAYAGQTVVRLTPGDPAPGGRGSDEAAHCRAHGIAVEVVPGIAAAPDAGACALAAVP